MIKISKTVLITGANGFIGKNLQLHLAERNDVKVICFTRDHEATLLPELIQGADFVFHLAGINRPQDSSEFIEGNTKLTKVICDAILDMFVASGKKIPIVFASSTQAAQDNPYGTSKHAAEDHLFALKQRHQLPVHVFRLPNVFGKWCKPNYNSVVATFCYNIARGLPIQINNPTSEVTLIYVDDVITRFLQLLEGANAEVDADGFDIVGPQFSSNVGELSRLIKSFRGSRETLMSERVGSGFIRALYATYVSYLPVELFNYPVPQYSDPRGIFVEMLKTPDCGQFSYFMAYPGVTRGGHYHHTKTEKFLVIKGKARFKFRHMHTGETHELVTQCHKPEVVETVPGWTHDITNIGEGEMLVLLWSNEVFDRELPDTFASKV